MNDLEYTLQKIQSLAKQPPDESIYKYLGDFADKEPLTRNYQLILLDNCPKSVQKDIRRLH